MLEIRSLACSNQDCIDSVAGSFRFSGEGDCPLALENIAAHHADTLWTFSQGRRKESSWLAIRRIPLLPFGLSSNINIVETPLYWQISQSGLMAVR